jgi:integrase
VDFGGKRHYLSTGFADTATNRKLAEIKARQTELDIISGNFDPSLDKYRIAPLASKPDSVTVKNSFGQSLDNLWERYTEFKRPILSTEYFVEGILHGRTLHRQIIADTIAR